MLAFGIVAAKQKRPRPLRDEGA